MLLPLSWQSKPIEKNDIYEDLFPGAEKSFNNVQVIVMEISSKFA